MGTRHAWCVATAEGLRLSLHIAPNGKKSEVLGLHDGALKIRLHAVPVDGKANEALLRFIADRLQVPRNAVTLLRGTASRQKLVEVRGPGLDLDVAAAAERLLALQAK